MARKPAFFWWIASLGAALVLCYAATGVELWRHARESKDYGWSRTLIHGSWYINFVVPSGPADGVLRRGDRILTFEGRQGPDWFVNRLVLLVPPGGTLHLTIERAGQRLDVAVRVRRVPVPVDWGIPLMTGASLVCFAVSMLMGLFKPGDRTVQFGCFALLALAALQLTRSLEFVYWSMDGWARVMFGLLLLSDPLAAPAGYLFAARFPKSIPASRGWKVLGVAICTLAAVEWLLVLPDRTVSMLNAEWTAICVRWVDGLLMAVAKIPVAFWKIDHLLIIVAIAAILIRNYGALHQPDLRRRIRWLVVGVVASLVPETLLYLSVLAYMLTGFGLRMDTIWFMRLEHLSTAFLGVVTSLAIAYGVLQHRVLDIHVVVRHSIQYLLTKRVLQAALSLPVILLVARAILNPELTVRGLLFGSYFYLSVAAVAALGLVYRHALLLAVDRRFFREEYNQEQILRTLIEEVKDRESITEMSRLVSAKVEAALHPRRILVLYRSESHGDFTLGHSSTAPGSN